MLHSFPGKGPSQTRSTPSGVHCRHFGATISHLLELASGSQRWFSGDFPCVRSLYIFFYSKAERILLPVDPLEPNRNKLYSTTPLAPNYSARGAQRSLYCADKRFDTPRCYSYSNTTWYQHRSGCLNTVLVHRQNFTTLLHWYLLLFGNLLQFNCASLDHFLWVSIRFS